MVMQIKLQIFQILTVLLVSFSSSVSVSSEYDVDGNGVDDALTDGILVLRHEFGLAGTTLTAGALAGMRPLQVQRP